MKTIQLVAVVTLVTAVSACSALKPGCKIQDTIVSKATDVVVENLQCLNAVEVEKDVESIVKELGLCKKAPTGPIAGLVCPSIASKISDIAASKFIPARWECSGAKAKSVLSQAILQACSMIPVKE